MVRAAVLDWIFGPGYSLGEYIWGVLNASLPAKLLPKQTKLLPTRVLWEKNDYPQGSLQGPLWDKTVTPPQGSLQPFRCLDWGETNFLQCRSCLLHPCQALGNDDDADDVRMDMSRGWLAGECINTSPQRPLLKHHIDHPGWDGGVRARLLLNMKYDNDEKVQDDEEGSPQSIMTTL